MFLNHAFGRANFAADDFLLYQNLFIAHALALSALLAVAVVVMKQAQEWRQLFEAVGNFLHFIDGFFDRLHFGHELAAMRDALVAIRLRRLCDPGGKRIARAGCEIGQQARNHDQGRDNSLHVWVIPESGVNYVNS